MKAIKNTSFSERIEGVQLFRENIEEILSLIKDKTVKIEIHDSNTIYEDLDEVIKLRGINPNEIEIEGRTDEIFKSVTVSIKKNKVWIHSRGSQEMYTFGFELKDYFRDRVHWLYKLLNPWIIIWVLFFSFFCSFFYDKTTKAFLYPWLDWVTLAAFMFFLLAIGVRYFCFGLTLSRKHEHGFWNRNKDKIILAILGAVFGSLVTLLIQWMTKSH